MTTEMAPLWDSEGQPVNLAAAALDALEWLRFLRSHMPEWSREPALERCIEQLKRLIPETYNCHSHRSPDNAG